MYSIALRTNSVILQIDTKVSVIWPLFFSLTTSADSQCAMFTILLTYELS